MLKVGQIVMADVTRVRQYGLELLAGEHLLLVLGPDLAPTAPEWQGHFGVGDRIKVRIIRVAEQENGTIYRAVPV